MKQFEFLKYALPIRKTKYGILLMVVDASMLLSMIIIGFLDLYSEKDFKGGILFYSAFVLSLILRMAWWKWQYKNKGKKGFIEII